jgi:hypothetical protein
LAAVGRRAQALGQERQETGIETVSLGEIAAGAGKHAGAQRIDHGDGKAIEPKRAMGGAMELAGCLHHDAFGPMPGQQPFQLADAGLVIAKPPAFAQRMQMNIEPLFTHVHTGINYRHRVFLERNLALHAGLAPHHLFRTNARTAGPISSPVHAKGPAVPAVRTPADGHPPECAQIIQQSVQIEHARG